MSALAFTNNEKSTSIPMGYAGAVVTVLIWATWILATRHSAATQLGTIDIGLIRYGVPALILAPVWLRTGLLPRGVPLGLLATMFAGAGAIFFQLTTSAIHSTPASAAGILLGGSMPLATALIGVAIFRERPDSMRVLGLAAIVAGVAILLIRSLAGAALPWSSFVLLPMGAILWASYTHAFRRSGLTAVQASALIAIWSFLVHVGLAVVFGTSITSAPFAEIGLQVLSQGVLSGLVATVAYGLAVHALGGTQAAAFTAITPVLATIGGAMLLGEEIGIAEIAAAVITGLGVAFSTGIASRR
ncbi:MULTISPECIES: DMT family transporter [unclassified Rhizobium]|uniref:DMT family transporter n=1 Tax=unclassified Rhizobium TaxID=2613769 RepID=UPI001052AE23|nr:MULTISPECIES: DMT family transporter [unclassified Rhizobium]MBB3397236.1 drug/metabolite transporter (DMT)-like permease [Rhizobium sp. BK060]MBB4168646.1 drug/metabolite transporter (DMT)-like permease [Rhizobium sp. BK538]TCM73522.1 EamA-like transporter family protein [Rhizobium sp. BK068]